MGVLDKIKNALFEVEYVEVEEPPEKEKKVKEKKVKEKKDSPKPIAKKIVLPGRKEEKIEELHEEELKDEDFEIRPKDENVKQVSHEEFKFMDDNDFKVEEEYPMEEPKILSVVPDKKNEDIVDDQDFTLYKYRMTGGDIDCEILIEYNMYTAPGIFFIGDISTYTKSSIFIYITNL